MAFQACSKLCRSVMFAPARDLTQYPFNKITQTFPLIYQNNLAFAAGRRFPYYTGSQAFDEDHAIPNLPKNANNTSRRHVYSSWDFFVNPTLINDLGIRPTEEYVGARTGVLVPGVGWLPVGSSRRVGNATQAYRLMRHKYLGQWLERNLTPRWKRAPRVGAGGPRVRYSGKLRYTQLTLKRLLWGIETGRLNPNEVITMYHLYHNGIINRKHLIWPGLILVGSHVEKVPFEIKLEIQRITPRALKLIEDAGGKVTCTYLSTQGMYEELQPEEFPVFHEQPLPDRLAFESVSSHEKKRGFLAQWYKDVVQFAHPDAGRRQAHYVAPPTPRDFPSTLEEYERVKHHQKWHLGQPGTGTVLPWLSERSLQRPTS